MLVRTRNRWKSFICINAFTLTTVLCGHPHFTAGDIMTQKGWVSKLAEVTKLEFEARLSESRIHTLNCGARLYIFERCEKFIALNFFIGG